MRRKPFMLAAGLVPALLLPGLLAWPSGNPGKEPAPGDPLPGLGADNLAAFADGLDEFTTPEEEADGLGPVFNARSCGECHAQGAAGGSSPDLGVSVVVRIGRLTNGLFDPLAELGGSVLQRRSIQEDMPDCPITGEVVPSEATLVSHRATPALFGDGLIEAIPAQEILRRAGRRDRDGVMGVPNLVLNPETGQQELGRFGWKAHAPTLHLFAGDAYLNEIGITSPTFPRENLPQGQPIAPEWDPIQESDGLLEDDGTDVRKVTDFMRFLAPIRRQQTSNPLCQAGERLFQQIGCASCHTPRMTTGPHPVAALSRRPVDLYSDLLLHAMGPGLADGIAMGQAQGDQWRTTPLWGLSLRRFLLHDGRAATVEDAVRFHGGEAANARARFAALRRRDRDAVLAFLGTL